MGQPSIYHATVALSFQIEICNLDRTKSSFLATSLYKKVIFSKNWDGLVVPATLCSTLNPLFKKLLTCMNPLLSSAPPPLQKYEVLTGSRMNLIHPISQVECVDDESVCTFSPSNIQITFKCPNPYSLVLPTIYSLHPICMWLYKVIVNVCNISLARYA